MAEIVNIPEDRWSEFEKAFNRLNKKCQAQTGSEMFATPIGKTWPKINGVEVPHVEVLLSVDPIKVEGWQFMARIDHSMGEPVVFTIDKEFQTIAELAADYSECKCDHCGITRTRKHTYILRDEHYTIKQVGSTCLKEFIGIDPVKALNRFKYLKLAYTRFSKYNTSLDWIDLELFVSSVIHSAQVNGWIGSKFAGENNLTPTYWDAWRNLNSGHINTANKLIAETLANTDDSLFMQNLRAIATNRVINSKQMALAAVIGKPKPQPKPVIANTSQHFATIGDRFEETVHITGNKLIETAFGTTRLITMSMNGNVLVTFASGKFNPTIGTDVKIKATIKDNTVFNRVNQTILTRVR